jgi:hypothetical protein
MGKTSNIFKLLAFTALILFLIQPYFTWFTADDFCLMGKIQADGLLRNMLHDYLIWDGRSISLTYPVCRAGLFAGVPWMGPLLGSLLMMIIAALMLKLAGHVRKDGVNYLLSILTLTLLLWLVYFNFLSQTLYWTTGVGYNMDIVMLLTAIWWMMRWKGVPLDFIVGLPVFFYAGTCSPNGVLALLFVFAVQWLHETVIQQSRNHLKYAYACLLVIIAMGLVVLSPGNKNRMTAWDWNNLTHIWTVYFNIKLLIKNLFNYNSLFIWPLIALGMAGATLKIASGKDALQGIFRKTIEFIFEHRLLFAAFISFFFFLPLPGMNSPRTVIQFASFATLYGLSHLPYILQRLNTEKIYLIRSSSLIIYLIFIVLAGTQAFDARFVKTQMAMRDAKLRELTGQVVVLTEKDYVRTPATRRFEDLSSDSSYWLNQCVAAHYGLKSIKLIDTRPKKVVVGVYTD